MSEPVRRPTRQRAAVEAVLRDLEDFMSAQGLHARLRAQGENVGLATVYRTLQSMANDGDVDMMRTGEGEAVYRRCSAGHHHHLVCRSCGRTVEVEGPAVESWADKVGADHGFSDVHHTLEVSGICSGCQPGDASAKSRSAVKSLTIMKSHPSSDYDMLDR